MLWVAERITEQAPDLPLWFAVDHEALAECIEGGGFRAIMTDSGHPSGTDRIAQANRRVRASYVINVQADEPLVTNGQIQALARMVQGECPMATLCTPFRRAADFNNPNQVKVVISKTGRAMYFSRAPIPYPRDTGGAADDAWVAANPCFKHLGLYAYKADFLERFVTLPPGKLEVIEKLEQLRALGAGYPIAIDITEDPSVGVDTADDVVRFEEMLETKGKRPGDT